MLFQPTNINPSTLSGAENSTVDVTEGMTVSWQLNGNSALVAYRLIILENSVTSTILYNTDIVVLDTPIYPVDYKGEQQRCTVEIPAAALATAGITNGNEYKIAIRQFWDADNLDASHSIRTSSDTLFHTRAAAHVQVIDPVPASNIASYEKTFTARYYQGTYNASAVYDPIEWVRWQIYDSRDLGRTIYDSGKIYTQELKLHYDGFLNGWNYLIVVELQNALGQKATGNAYYTNTWDAEITKDIAVATRLNDQSSAVQVSWDSIDYIPGEGSGNWSIKDGKLKLDDFSSVTWNKRNDAPFLFNSPLALVMKTTYTSRDQMATSNILVINMTNGQNQITNYIQAYPGAIVSYINGSSVSSRFYVDPLFPDTTLKIYMDDTTLKIYKVVEGSGGLTPSTTLTPSGSLIPTWDDTVFMELLQERTYSSLAGYDITEIMAAQIQTIEYISIVENVETEQETVMQQWASSLDDDLMAVISTYPNTVFYTDFEKGLDAGSYSIGGIQITGWDVYRKRYSEAFMKHLCTLKLSSTFFYDYGCASNGTYTYFIYPRSAEGTHITTALQSNTILPVFWNWSIIEAEHIESENKYNVINEYVFRNNVASGSVSNNNMPTVSENFTRYPTVQMSCSNYQSGTLEGLIGQVGYTSYVVQYGNSLTDLTERFKTSKEDILAQNDLASWQNHGYTGMVVKLFDPNGMTAYRDDKEQRDALWSLSTTTNHLFLKSRKGDVIEIKIAGAINMTTADNTPQQAITASIPWVQIDDAQEKSIICEVG